MGVAPLAHDPLLLASLLPAQKISLLVIRRAFD
jgi:hypothetical protein